MTRTLGEYVALGARRCEECQGEQSPRDARGVPDWQCGSCEGNGVDPDHAGVCPACKCDYVPVACTYRCGYVAMCCACVTDEIDGNLCECWACIRKRDPDWQPPCWRCEGEDSEDCDVCKGTGLRPPPAGADERAPS